MNRKLFTIGYTGLSIDEFVDTLLDASIEHLADVREIPLSRKRGFSKSALSEVLGESGITYSHHKWLGSPKALRHAVRVDRNYTRFFVGVDKHLQMEDSQSDLDEVIMIARKKRVCMMCCCPDWELCHRLCVVEAIQQKSWFFVDHLAVDRARPTGKAA